MSPALLLVGSVIAVLALVGVLAVYLYIIGTAVQHVAETLDQKVAAGAAEIGQHVAALPAAANGVRRGVGSLAQYGKDLL